jgi:hypothetical protein
MMMKRTNKSKRSDSKSFRYVSKTIHRTSNLRGVGHGLIDDLREELIVKREVKERGIQS